MNCFYYFLQDHSNSELHLYFLIFIFYLCVLILLQITFMELRLISRIRITSSSVPQTVLLSLQLKIQMCLFIMEIIFLLIPNYQILSFSTDLSCIYTCNVLLFRQRLPFSLAFFFPFIFHCKPSQLRFSVFSRLTFSARWHMGPYEWQEKDMLLYHDIKCI